ncbi:hypothetical protein F4821DRAFT_137958 [Hypoxylon rubiginosum]|uniref:Uncharacterized protein n=1 Tax=Hypoxylon rubiginosum TaxID=110542 RepID=A0ACC0DIP0_9PEZI|nr:hypothetical protein F4821DRAFT_137958 [Hypoxylon rubiginosum]
MGTPFLLLFLFQLFPPNLRSHSHQGTPKNTTISVRSPSNHLLSLQYVLRCDLLNLLGRKINGVAAKKSWRGCGSHIPAALAGVPEDQWCTCEPRVAVDGKAYPPSAKMQIPGLSWLGSMFGGGSGSGGEQAKETKGKGEL